MRTLILFLFLCVFVTPFRAQTLFNGDFSLGTLFWGCGPETNAETLYGGGGSNEVAEVDAVAGLCQTVSGLTTGQLYALSFDASRRTGTCPSPSVTNVNITISNGALSTTVTRTNTTFGFTTSGFIFTATSNALTITFSAGTGFAGSTCGLIVDNISVSATALPIELVSFDGATENSDIRLSWLTVTEKNNDHFEVERSSDGVNFQSILSRPSKAATGNSSVKLSYEAIDASPLLLFNYYRLNQVDREGTSAFSKIIVVNFNPDSEDDVTLYPNPNDGKFTLRFPSANSGSSVNVLVIGTLGKSLHSQTYAIEKYPASVTIELPEVISPGIYHCVVSGEAYSRHFSLAVK